MPASRVFDIILPWLILPCSNERLIDWILVTCGNTAKGSVHLLLDKALFLDSTAKLGSVPDCLMSRGAEKGPVMGA
ncbi:hypothetical protein CKO51_21235 [Rhodopirellula sp. SM50]|nr:hypothetical protein CKO51_21235 [Rhodopirellula sp. SM50]